MDGLSQKRPEKRLKAMSFDKSLTYNGHHWSSMRQDCIKIVKACLACQQFNIGKHGFHPLKFILALLPFDHIAIDLKEFIESLKGNTYLLVVVDVCTRYVFLRTLRDKSTYSIASALFVLFCDIGFPRIVQSDNGPEFVNAELKELIQLSQMDHRLITAYHPRANGLVERWVQTTSQTIYKLLNGRDTHWDNYVPSVQFYTNLKVSKFHNFSPYSLLFARQANHFLHLPTDATESSTMTLPETLKERLEYMTKVVYPTVFEKVTKAKKFQEEVFNQKNKMILD
jgi:hypothetical protein